MKHIILYRCQNCGGPKRIVTLPYVREFILSCGGQFEVIHALRPFEDGELGVCLVHCDPGKCKTLEGSARGLQRMRHAGRLLEEAGVPKNRLKTMLFEKGCDLEKALSDFRENITKES